MAGPTGNESNHILDGLTVRGGLALAGVGGVSTYVNSDVVALLARASVIQRGQALLTETFPRLNAVANTATVSGTAYFVGVGLLAGDLVRRMHVAVAAGSSAPTLTKCGLYSKTGTLLASSVDESAAFGTATVKTLAMTTPYTVPTDDIYFACFLNVAGTGANMIRTGININAGSYAAITGGVGVLGNQASQTDLPAAATINFASGSPIPYWIGIA